PPSAHSAWAARRRRFSDRLALQMLPSCLCVSVILRRHDEGSIQLLVFGAGAADPSQANVILSEASPRAKSKDPHLVASSAWVADPSQANVILSEASLRAKSKDPQLVGSSAWVAEPSQAQDDMQPVDIQPV